MSSDIMNLLVNMDSKLGLIIPQIKVIEQRLHDIEVRLCPSIGANGTPSDPTLSDTSDSISDISNSVTDISEKSDVEDSVVDTDNVAIKFGLLMSDSDMSDEAHNLGKLLSCEVSMFDYSTESLDPSLFNRELEFVVLQDSGKFLDQYTELTEDTVQHMTSRVRHLVSLSTNIVQVQPKTQVFLGSLPPRLDKSLRRDLIRVFNGLLITESFLVDRIDVIDQSQLLSRYEKKFYQRYSRDKATLTKYGGRLRDKNIAKHIVKSVSGLSVTVQKKRQHQHGPTHDNRCGGYSSSKGAGLREENQTIKSFLVNILQNL